MRLFDYIFYRTYNLYFYKWKDDDPKIYAIVLVSFLQSIHVLSLLFICSYLINLKFNIHKIYVAAFFIAIIALNFYRYREKGNSFELLKGKWKNEIQEKRKIFGYLIILYIVFSIVLFIASAYLGSSV